MARCPPLVPRALSLHARATSVDFLPHRMQVCGPHSSGEASTGSASVFVKNPGKCLTAPLRVTGPADRGVMGLDSPPQPRVGDLVKADLHVVRPRQSPIAVARCVLDSLSHWVWGCSG